MPASSGVGTSHPPPECYSLPGLRQASKLPGRYLVTKAHPSGNTQTSSSLWTASPPPLQGGYHQDPYSAPFLCLPWPMKSPMDRPGPNHSGALTTAQPPHVSFKRSSSLLPGSPSFPMVHSFLPLRDLAEVIWPCQLCPNNLFLLHALGRPRSCLAAALLSLLHLLGLPAFPFPVHCWSPVPPPERRLHEVSCSGPCSLWDCSSLQGPT